MELLTAIVEVASNIQIVPTSVREPACDPSFINAILNSGLVQMIWGWTKSVPVLAKWILGPAFAIIVLVFLLGMRRAGAGLIRWILIVVLLVVALITLPGLITTYNLFGSC